MYDYMSNEELADCVRMLTRSDLNHEAILVAARNRIKDLSNRLMEADERISELENECNQLARDGRYNY